MRWTPPRVRLAGVAAVVGGLLWFVPLGSLGSGVAFSVGGPLLVTVPALLVGAGVLAFRARYGDAYGTWGRRGVLGILVGLAVFAVASSLLFQFPGLEDGTIPEQGFPPEFYAVVGALALGMLLLVGASAVLGVACWRRRVGPRLGSGLLVAQVGTFLLGDALVVVAPTWLGETGALSVLLTQFAFGAAWVVFGLHLWRTGDESSVAGTPVEQSR